MDSVQTLIYVIIAFCVILAIALIGVLGYVWYKDNAKNLKRKTKSDKADSSKNDSDSQTRLQGIESMSKFLAFDEIVDSMIVRKKRTQYVMVLQCKGINFDLLGDEEKMAVETGFVQFLNTLRFPVQLYIQSRSLNLKNNIDKYQDRINEVNNDIIKIDAQIKKERANGRLDLVRKLEFERKRKVNILEYGLDISNYVSRLSQNRNVLQQNTYVAIAYYTSEFGGSMSNYSKEEIDNIAFSELYTRAQTVIRALSSSGVVARVMSSEELAELLYIAYNRDDSELISVRSAIDEQYDSLYNTAKDVMDKQKEMIEQKVEQEAVNLTADSISRADRILKLRRENKEEIRRRALAYVEKYKGDMNDDLYQETKRQVEKADITNRKSMEEEKREQEELLARRERARKEIEQKELARRAATRKLAAKRAAARQTANSEVAAARQTANSEVAAPRQADSNTPVRRRRSRPTQE